MKLSNIFHIKFFLSLLFIHLCGNAQTIEDQFDSARDSQSCEAVGSSCYSDCKKKSMLNSIAIIASKNPRSIRAFDSDACDESCKVGVSDCQDRVAKGLEQAQFRQECAPKLRSSNNTYLKCTGMYNASWQTIEVTLAPQDGDTRCVKRESDSGILTTLAKLSGDGRYWVLRKDKSGQFNERINRESLIWEVRRDGYGNIKIECDIAEKAKPKI